MEGRVGPLTAAHGDNAAPRPRKLMVMMGSVRKSHVVTTTPRGPNLQNTCVDFCYVTNEMALGCNTPCQAVIQRCVFGRGLMSHSERAASERAASERRAASVGECRDGPHSVMTDDTKASCKGTEKAKEKPFFSVFEPPIRKPKAAPQVCNSVVTSQRRPLVETSHVLHVLRWRIANCQYRDSLFQNRNGVEICNFRRSPLLFNRPQHHVIVVLGPSMQHRVQQAASSAAQHCLRQLRSHGDCGLRLLMYCAC